MNFTEIKKGTVGRTADIIPQGVASITKDGVIAIARSTIYKSLGTIPSSFRVMVSDDKKVVRLMAANNGDGYKAQVGRLTVRLGAITPIRKSLKITGRFFCTGTGHIDINL